MTLTFRYDPSFFPTLSVVLPNTKNGLCWVYSYNDNRFRTREEYCLFHKEKVDWVLENWDEIIRQAKEYLLKESL